ncbi:MAG: recombinase family protein [Massilimicrobiota sp.]|nr:recombinase family protein [Massilimicrobiota sp.]
MSKEDDRRDESSSIESQKMIIESFAKFNDLKIIRHYSDDGFTGSNFNRPGFEQLKKDIEEGLINCVIVKDLSRLGRELYETGSYIEEYFLSKQVRFIAINDGYDSNVGDSMLGIRLSVNDLYLRDTSKKIRSSFDAKRKKGDYIGTYAKYGYMKDPNNPKHLIPDSNVSNVVVQIFEWLAEGVGTSTIAHRLTVMNIPIPSIYKKENRQYNQKEFNHGNGIWRPQTVKAIGSDQMYLGHMVQGRWKKLSYNSKKLIELPESQWVIVKNTHNPLVSQELFDKAQVTLNKSKKYRAKKEKKYLFQGLLKCKECGHNISIYRKKTKTGYSLSTECNYYSKYSKYGFCCSHRINYDLFEKDMLHFLKELGERFLVKFDDKKLLENSLRMKRVDEDRIQKKLLQIDKELEKNQNILSHLYEDRLNDVITVRQYSLMAKKYDEVLASLEQQQEDLKHQLESLQDNHRSDEIKECKELIEKFMKFEMPSNELMYQLIDRIEIDKDKNIEVFFKVDIGKYVDCIAENRSTNIQK